MRWRSLIVCVMVSLLVLGCARLPSFNDTPVSTADIIRNIKCELRDAAWGYTENSWVRKWKASLIISLEVSHTGGLGVDNSWVWPASPGGIFAPGLLGGFSGQGTRTERINFNESLTQLGSDQALLCGRDDPARYARLGGTIGIADLFARVGRTKEIANINPTQMDYNLDFVIKVNAGVTPKYSLIPIGSKSTYSGSLGWTGSTSDTQTLKLVLIPPAPAERPAACEQPLVYGRCPQPVYIVKLPEPGAGTTRMLPPGGTPLPTVRRGASPGVSVDDEDRLERGKSRNLLQGIDDQLRRQSIGN